MIKKPTYAELEQRVRELEQLNGMQLSTDSITWEDTRVYRTLFDASADAISIIDVKTGKYLDCNPAAVELHRTGSRKDYIGLTPDQLSPQYQPNGELSSELAEKKIQEAFESGAIKFEWLHCKRDGTPFPANVTLSAMVLGKKRMVIAIVRDITARLHSKSRLEKLNQLNEQLLITGNLTTKLKLITDAIVEVFNADFARIWLLQRGDLCQSGCIHTDSRDGDGCERHTECLHLRSSSGRYTHIEGDHRRVPFGAYKIGRIASGEEAKFVTRVLAEDSRIQDKEWATRIGLKSFAGYRLLSESGRPMGVLALSSKYDITPEEDVLLGSIVSSAAQVIQTETAKETLKESEAFLDAIVENIPDMIFVKNADDLSFARFNRAGEELLGYKREELYGKSDFDFFPKVEAQFFIQKDRDVLNNGSLLDIPEEEIHTRLKGTRVLHAKKIPLLDENGTPRYLLGISEDITEKRQAEEQQRLQAQIIDQIHDSVIATDIDGVITSWNKGSERLFHYNSGDIVGKHVAELYPERTHHYLSEDVIPTLLSKGSHGYEIPLVRKGGDEFPALVSLSVLKDKTGNVNGMIGYTLDITEQKQAQTELQLREQLLEFAIEQMPMPVIIADAPDVTITRYNTHAVDLLAKPAEDLKTIELHKHREFWPTFYPDDTPYDPDELPLTRAIKRGDVSRDVEVIIRKEDQECWVSASAAPLHDAEGEIIAGIVVFPDITERKQALKAIQESEEKFRAIFQQAAVGVAVTSAGTGEYIQINKKYCDIVGYPEKKLKSLTFRDITHPDDLQADLDKMRDLAEDRIQDYSIEKRYLHRDGSIVWVNLNVSPMLKIEGQPTHYIAVIEDITARKLMEAEVKTLSGLLPICAACKKIRDDQGYWNQIETYVKAHSEADFSHSICPECAKRLYPGLDLDKG